MSIKKDMYLPPLATFERKVFFIGYFHAQFSYPFQAEVEPDTREVWELASFV